MAGDHLRAQRHSRKASPLGRALPLMAMLGMIVASGCSTEPAKSAGRNLGSSCIPPALNPLAPKPPPPKAISTPLESSIRSRFAIFRRSPRRGDRFHAPTSGAGNELARVLGNQYELSSYYTAYVRRLPRPPAVGRSYVVPAYGRTEAVPPARCFSKRIWGSGARRRTELVEQERRREVEPVACIVVARGNASSPGGQNANLAGCTPFAQIESGAAAFGVSDFHGEPATELVPDGVATVRVTYSSTAPILARVSENAFVLTPPKAPANRLDAELRGLERRLSDKHLANARRERLTLEYDRKYTGTYPLKVEWLDDAGKAVRTITRAEAQASNAATSVGNLRAPAESSASFGG